MMYVGIPVAATLAPPGTPSPLHAPDGFFSLPVAAVGYGLSAAAVGYAIYRTNRQLDEKLVPLMGVMAAFIFAAQMLNFPVAGGTSGHLVGGALAAILLGPWAAVLVMAAVVSLQALLFQDGGLVVMGVNIFNMAVVGCLSGYLVYRLAGGFSRAASTLLLRGFMAAYVSVLAPAMLVAVELAISGTSPFPVAFPAMTGVHALIGIGEGLITVGALAFVRAVRPDLLRTFASREVQGGPA